MSYDTRGKIVAALLGIAGGGLMALGLGSTPASADPYCGPGYHWYAGYCYPNPVVYTPPAPVYYPAPYYSSPVLFAPSIGFTFGFGGGHHFHTKLSANLGTALLQGSAVFFCGRRIAWSARLNR